MRLLNSLRRPSIYVTAGLVLVGLAVLLPGSASSIYWGDGEWRTTSYSSSTPNNCDTAAGEFCKEWEVNGIGTGDLCCVSGSTCQARNLRLP